MITTRPPILLWIAPAALLIAALLPLPYGYYTFLRLVVTGCSAFLAYWTYSRDKGWTTWVIVLAAFALLFNPLVPVHLSREIWAVLDLGAAAVFIAHFALIGRIGTRN